MTRPAADADLFAWRDAADARAAAAEATERREVALARYRHAPHGEVLNRLRALQEATEAALRADMALAAATRRGLN